MDAFDESLGSHDHLSVAQVASDWIYCCCSLLITWWNEAFCQKSECSNGDALTFQQVQLGRGWLLEKTSGLGVGKRRKKDGLVMFNSGSCLHSTCNAWQAYQDLRKHSYALNSFSETHVSCQFCVFPLQALFLSLCLPGLTISQEAAQKLVTTL